jgi:hypothetical protein
MDKDAVKQHIVNVLTILMILSDRFDLKEISLKLADCHRSIQLPAMDQILKAEIVQYHTADAED